MDRKCSRRGRILDMWNTQLAGGAAIRGFREQAHGARTSGSKFASSPPVNQKEGRVPGQSRHLVAFRTAVLLLLALTQTACLGYLSRAGMGQLEILWNRRPIPEVIADPKTEPEIRRKLEHVQKVRIFAADQLGLQVDDTYTQYTKLERDALAWNVSGSRKLRFEAKTWWFPIVGTVPYLGFFSKAEAEAARRELEAEDYEAIVTTVAGYSTLGWFDDPLVSPQARFSDLSLAELVIHESAHATLWFPGDVGFNESFASFVGRAGAYRFYEELHGPDSPTIVRHRRYLQEINDLSLILHHYAKLLNDTYNQNKTDDWKLQSRYRLIEELRETLRRRAPEFQILNLKRLQEREWNNAHFLSHLRYQSGENYFERVFEDECSGQWPCFLGKMQALRDIPTDERRALLKTNSSKDK